MAKNERIKVAVRKRPMGKKEIARNDMDIMTTNGVDCLVVHEPKVKVDMTK